MASADPATSIAESSQARGAGLLVMFAGNRSAEYESVVTHLLNLFSAHELILATENDFSSAAHPSLRTIEAPESKASLTFTAADFATAHDLMQRSEAQAALMLGREAGSLGPAALLELASAALGGSADLAIPCYDLPPHAGLVNSAIVYPLTRTLFASSARFPLAIDLGLSPRMAEKLAAAARRFTAQSVAESIVWPVNEAAVAGLTVREFDVGTRILPQPAEGDVNAVLSSIVGSLFSDIEAKAAFWQRARALPPRRSSSAQAIAQPDGAAETGPMVEKYRLAFANLQEIWSLVLPPNSMLGLKRLSTAEAGAFQIPDTLWARIVFDFLIAYRMRTMNRGHLLGALIPLYLAWVASHINITAGGISPQSHIEAVAAAFEADKPYLVARWRWPDRFNP